MSKFIITGATGFVGSNLARKLVKDNHSVSIICRPSSDLKNIKDILDKVRIFRYDGEIENLIDFFDRVKPDCVFHLASLFIAQHNENDVDQLINSNIKFSTQILEAMNQSGTKNIVNTSTSWQHYDNEDYNPSCLYAATKKAFEDILTFYTKAYGFKSISLSLFDTYGENDTRNKLINNLKDISKKEIELDMSMGYQEIDLTHIKDIVKGFYTAYLNTITMDESDHKFYALSSQRRITLRELVSIFEKVNDLKIHINWGKKSYRYREIMKPWENYILLPNWSPTISLEEGLKRVGKRKEL